MKLSGNTVLVTGGASGIGLGLAERFRRAGSEVIVCGRREEKLREAQERIPGLRVRIADLAGEDGRVALAEWVVREFPALNVLVNNAGIQVHTSLLEASHWDQFREELAINLHAPIQLSMLLLPHLRRRERAAIVNVSSGLAFAPLARTPVYAATKAALHSFTQSLRRQVEGSGVEVVELIPPAVDTDLGGPGLHTFGVKVDELLDAVLPRIEAGEREVAYGFAQQSSQASRAELDALAERMNQASR
ncbi:MAG TPA: SDR family NAD(P)-dependent oxidoreductase [Thermoanaerobaculia bacterium]|jgi:uncharacterized oxidoreductase